MFFYKIPLLLCLNTSGKLFDGIPFRAHHDNPPGTNIRMGSHWGTWAPYRTVEQSGTDQSGFMVTMIGVALNDGSNFSLKEANGLPRIAVAI